nr:TetR family transcriptional regulator [Chloroflexia bacterium]
MLRQALLEGFFRPLAARLEGPDVLARVELIGSTLLGVHVNRTVIGDAEGADEERLIALLAPALQAYIDGPE